MPGSPSLPQHEAWIRESPQQMRVRGRRDGQRRSRAGRDERTAGTTGIYGTTKPGHPLQLQQGTDVNSRTPSHCSAPKARVYPQENQGGPFLQLNILKHKHHTTVLTLSLTLPRLRHVTEESEQALDVNPERLGLHGVLERFTARRESTPLPETTCLDGVSHTALLCGPGAESAQSASTLH